MRRGRIEVASQVVDVELHHAGNMGAVKGRDNVFGAGQRGDLFGRQDHAGGGADMAYEDDAGARGDSVIDAVEDFRRILRRLGQLEFLYYNAISLGSQVPVLHPAG